MFAPPQWQVSTGDLFELLRPAAYALAVLVSALVLANALRRRFRPRAVILWTLSTLLLPHVVPFLYLVTYLLRPTRRTGPAHDTTTGDNATSVDTKADDAAATGDAPTDADDAPGAHPTEAGPAAGQPSLHQAPGRTRARLAFVLPALYALALLGCGALYFYADYQSFDAHLARAAGARLRHQPERAEREYRAALRRADDPHTHKLLALQLAEARRFDEALAEFRLAERGGEPDPALPLLAARALEALGRAGEAAPEYQRFLAGPLCTHTPPDPRCDAARTRLGALVKGQAR